MGRKEAARVERYYQTPEGEVMAAPKCHHEGQGATIAGAPCGEGFETKASWCLHCVRDHVERALLWAYGSDRLKAEIVDPGFYCEDKD